MMGTRGGAAGRAKLSEGAGRGQMEGVDSVCSCESPPSPMGVQEEERGAGHDHASMRSRRGARAKEAAPGD